MIQKVGSYQILGTLRAGTRPLYKAQAAGQKIVALKTIPANGVTPEERERFQREAQICAGLDHPNLLKVHDSGEADGILYQAMDLLEGSDLAQIFGEGRRLSWEEKLSIMEQVCAGLDYAHERKLVHRDIKPANIFLETSGNVRVLDFGMVRTSASNLTRAGSTLGTANYMSPEQIRGETCTTAADVFSSGIVFYQLASGQHPFSRKGSGLAQIVSAILFEAPAPLSKVAAGAPEGLEFVVNKALEKDPGKRWKDGGDFGKALALCRLTLRMQPRSETPAGVESPAKVSKPELKKTVLIERVKVMVPTPPPERPKSAEPPAPPAPLPAPPVVTPPRTPVKGDPAAAPIYCAACTAANPPGTLVCSECGTPLAAVAPPMPPPARIPWPAIVVISVLVLLLVVALVLLLRR